MNLETRLAARRLGQQPVEAGCQVRTLFIQTVQFRKTVFYVRAGVRLPPDLPYPTPSASATEALNIKAFSGGIQTKSGYRCGYWYEWLFSLLAYIIIKRLGKLWC